MSAAKILAAHRRIALSEHCTCGALCSTGEVHRAHLASLLDTRPAVDREEAEQVLHRAGIRWTAKRGLDALIASGVLLDADEERRKAAEKGWDEGWIVGADDQKSWNENTPGFKGATDNPYRAAAIRGGDDE